MELLVNGSSNNGASSPFATNPAFGNNRVGQRGLYNGGLTLVLNNSVLDANTYSVTGQATPKPSFNNVTATADIGGPLKIKHLFVTPPNFYLSYTWTRNEGATTTPGKMPTVAQRAGDFSALGTVITDPTTGAPFAGNVIPQGRISPTQALSFCTPQGFILCQLRREASTTISWRCSALSTRIRSQGG